MRIYTISGLGADQRVSQYLSLNVELVPLGWIPPRPSEPIAQYARRLAGSVDATRPFGLVGVSFGGLVAVEMCRVVAPEFLILISSVARRSELPWHYRVLGATGILRLAPKQLFDPPRRLAHWAFGTARRRLLDAILRDTDLGFAKWAVQALVSRKSDVGLSVPTLRVHGSADRLLPPSGAVGEVIIPGGHHFMIVDRAGEVSTAINAWSSGRKVIG